MTKTGVQQHMLSLLFYLSFKNKENETSMKGNQRKIALTKLISQPNAVFNLVPSSLLPFNYRLLGSLVSRSVPLPTSHALHPLHPALPPPPPHLLRLQYP